MLLPVATASDQVWAEWNANGFEVERMLPEMFHRRFNTRELNQYSSFPKIMVP
jgi:hypothetical protein